MAGKRLTKLGQMESIRRNENAARTEEGFLDLIKIYDDLDANRERKERYHEVKTNEYRFRYAESGRRNRKFESKLYRTEPKVSEERQSENEQLRKAEQQRQSERRQSEQSEAERQSKKTEQQQQQQTESEQNNSNQNGANQNKPKKHKSKKKETAV